MQKAVKSYDGVKVISEKENNFIGSRSLQNIKILCTPGKFGLEHNSPKFCGSGLYWLILLNVEVLQT